jgi:hypothetical protein
MIGWLLRKIIRAEVDAYLAETKQTVRLRKRAERKQPDGERDAVLSEIGDSLSGLVRAMDVPLTDDPIHRNGVM